MIDYYKVISDGYIDGFGTNGPEDVTEITEEEYNELSGFFKTMPKAPEGYSYLLQDDPLEWVLVELPPDDPDVDDAEALEILLGGAL